MSAWIFSLESPFGYEVDASAWADRGPLPVGLKEALAPLANPTVRYDEVAKAWDDWDLNRWNPNELTFTTERSRTSYSFAQWVAGRSTSIESQAMAYFLSRQLDLSGALNLLLASHAAQSSSSLGRRIETLLTAATDDQLRQPHPLYVTQGSATVPSKGVGTVLHQFILTGDDSFMKTLRDRCEALVEQGLPSSPERSLPKLLKAKVKDYDWGRHAWLLRADEWAALTRSRQPMLLYLVNQLADPAASPADKVHREGHAKGIAAIARRLGDRLGAHVFAHPEIARKARPHLDLPELAELVRIDQAMRRQHDLAQRPVTAAPSRLRRRS